MERKYKKFMKVMLLTPEDLEQTWVQRDGQLIDLRSPKAFREGHIPGARNVPEEQLEQFLAKQNRQKFFILYCQRGITSLYLGRKFAEKGYQIGALAGGMNAYEKWKL